MLLKEINFFKKILIESFFGKLRVPFYLSFLYFLIEFFAVSFKIGFLYWLNYLFLFFLVTFIYPYYFVKFFKKNKLKFNGKLILKHYLIYLVISFVLILISFILFISLAAIFMYFFINGVQFYDYSKFTTALLLHPFLLIAAFLFTLILTYTFLFFPLEVITSLKKEVDEAFLKAITSLKNLFSFKTWILLIIFLMNIVVISSIDNKFWSLILSLTTGSVFSYLMYFSLYYYYTKKPNVGGKDFLINLIVSFTTFLIATLLFLSGKIEKSLFIIVLLLLLISLPFKAINYVSNFNILIYLLSLVF